jgi:hypothetical protein
MRLFRWAARLFPSRPTVVRFATGAGRVLVALWSFAFTPGGLLLAGLCLMIAGAWQVSPPAALVLAGLILIRDAERPDPEAKS